jgi:cytochrome c oxidase subunit 3
VAEDTAVVRPPARLGMWVFLASEIMMFGGLFMALAVMRWRDAAAWKEGSRHLHLWLGTANTAILLISSVVVALAVTAARYGRRREAAWELAGAAILGLAFLGIKATEWGLEAGEGLMLPQQPGLRLFFAFYYVATGLHALHLGVGVLVTTALAFLVRRSPDRAGAVEMGGLYWHFVDVVWIFLYPLLYLAAPR